MRKREIKTIKVFVNTEEDRREFVKTLTDVKKEKQRMAFVQTTAAIGTIFFVIGFAMSYAHDKGYPFSENVAFAFCSMGVAGMLTPLISAVCDLFVWIKSMFF